MRLTAIASLAVLLVAPATRALAQTSEEIGIIRSGIDLVRDDLRTLRDDLEAIRKTIESKYPNGVPGGAPGAAPSGFRPIVINVEGAPFVGGKDAKVAVVEFSDYQCPVSALHFRQNYRAIEKEYIKTGKIRYYFRDYPLEAIHPAAFKAAEAARCSGEQGKYWEMHDRLFGNQSALSATDLLAHAKALGLGPQRFKACLDAAKQGDKVRADMEEGRKAAVVGTPSVFFGYTDGNPNAVRAVNFVSGAPGFDDFKAAIDELLRLSEGSK